MSYFLCNCCGTVFDGNIIKNSNCFYTTNCPISTCCGIIFECDEEMLVPISILNEKGYITEFCCSGHIYDTSNSGYIMFADNEYIPYTTPQGWTIDNDGRTIRYEFSKNATIFKKVKERHKKIENLLKWCEELEYIDC